MVDGIRAGADGLQLLGLKMDALASNIANVSTVGYRKDAVEAIATAEKGGTTIRTAGYVDFSHGEPVQTSNPLDVALEGGGFFAVGSGEEAGYTRDGRFTTDMKGLLVTAAGQPVQGSKGPIKLSPALATVINADGSVMQGGRMVGQLKLVGFEDNSKLVKNANGLLVTQEKGKPAAGTLVRQGFVEGSNVRMVEEMASMMKVMSSFEGLQRAMTTQDGATGKLISTLGRYY